MATITDTSTRLTHLSRDKREQSDVTVVTSD
jgi:hypothetical protein